MKKICIFVGLTVMSSVGWWLGAKVGFMTGYFMAGLGSMAGVYLGWRFYRDYLE